MAPRYLKWFTVSNFCPCIVMSLCKVPLFVIILIFSALISMPNFAAAVSKLCTSSVSSSSSPVIPSMSSAKRRFVIRRKLKWYGHVTRSDGQTKVILQGTVEGSRRRGRPKKSWSDNIAEWTGTSLAETQAMAHNRQEWREAQRADEEVHHDAPLRLLAELRDQGKANPASLIAWQSGHSSSSRLKRNIAAHETTYRSGYEHMRPSSLWCCHTWALKR